MVYDKEKQKIAQRKYYEKHTLDHFIVYYLPMEHYIGVTNNPKYRMKQHLQDKHDITDWRVMYCSEDRIEIVYYEALFQSVLGINGIKLN